MKKKKKENEINVIFTKRFKFLLKLWRNKNMNSVLIVQVFGPEKELLGLVECSLGLIWRILLKVNVSVSINKKKIKFFSKNAYFFVIS